MPQRTASARRRLWWSAGILGAIVIALAVGWPRVRLARQLATARGLLGQGDFAAAVDALEAAESVQPNRAEVQYLLAAANRRAGRFESFAAHLRKAADLGWPPDDVQLQQWLAAAQSGDFEAVRTELTRIIEGGAPDDAAEEIYEAVARGHLASYRLREAWLCLDMWLQWRPDAPHARLMRALVHERSGRPAEAIGDYRAALASLPTFHEARLRLGECLLLQNEPDAAREHFAEAVAESPDDQAALVGLLECEARLGNAPDARQHIARALAGELSPFQKGRVLTEQGRLLLDEGKPAEAIASLEQAVALAPGHNLSHHALATALARSGKLDRARAESDRSRQVRARFDRMEAICRQLIDKPDNADLRCEAGLILIEQGLAADGANWLLSALKCDSRHPQTHQALAEHYRRTGENDKAAGHRRMRLAPALDALGANRPAEARRDLEALEKAPGFGPHCRFLRGAILLHGGEFYPALEHFGHAVNEPGLRAPALTLSGQALYQLHRYREAVGVLTRAVEIDPDAVDAHRWLASAYYDLGLRDQAMEHLTRIAELAPVDPRPHRLMGLIRKDFEVFARAAESYRESLRRDPRQRDREDVLLELAECQLKLRQDQAAMETLSEAQPSPGRWVLEAECHDRAGRAGEALALLEKALAQAPAHLQGLLLKGSILLERGDAKAAADLLSRAVAANPKDYTARSKLLQAYRRLGDNARVQEHSRAAEELKQLREEFSKLHEKAAAEPGNADVRCRLGVLAGRLDRNDLARVWFQAALAIDPRHAETLRQLGARPKSTP